MEFKKNIKEYYSAVIAETENCSGEVPYSPEDELLEIKHKIYKRKKIKKQQLISVTAAVAAVVVIGVSFVGINRPIKEAIIVTHKNNIPTDSDTNAVSSTTIAQIDDMEVYDYSAKSESAPEFSEVGNIDEEDIIYTPVPQITVPPMPKITEKNVATDVDKEETNPSYILDDPIPQEPQPTSIPGISIREKEYIPSGAAMQAGAGEQPEGGELWSEEDYFSYLGKNPIDKLVLPSDMVKSVSEEKFMLMDESGRLINDHRTFNYANPNRTRLLNITISKLPFGDIEDGGTEINGIRVSVFDNHMLNTAIFEGTDIYLMAEVYGLSEEELLDIIYSLAEGMAL